MLQPLSKKPSFRIFSKLKRRTRRVSRFLRFLLGPFSFPAISPLGEAPSSFGISPRSINPSPFLPQTFRRARNSPSKCRCPFRPSPFPASSHILREDSSPGSGHFRWCFFSRWTLPVKPLCSSRRDWFPFGSAPSGISSPLSLFSPRTSSISRASP